MHTMMRLKCNDKSCEKIKKVKTFSSGPDLNQRPMDYWQINHYSPPLYQLSYQRKYTELLEDRKKKKTSNVILKRCLSFVAYFL